MNIVRAIACIGPACSDSFLVGDRREVERGAQQAFDVNTSVVWSLSILYLPAEERDVQILCFPRHSGSLLRCIELRQG